MRSGVKVHLTSRSLTKAEAAGLKLEQKISDHAGLVAHACSSPTDLADAMGDSQIVFACGGAGVVLWPQSQWQEFANVQVAVDVNAVPPTGIEAIGATDKAKQIDGRSCFGAIGVGGLKMKIHRQCIRQLFTQNDLVLDVAEIFEIGKTLINS